MEAVVRLVVMLLGVCHGVETYCDGKQDGVQCYGALGGTVDIQLMDNAFNIPRYEWKKNSAVIFTWRLNQTLNNIIGNRAVFIPSNGTFRINKLSRSDSSQYMLTIFDADGANAEQRSLQLSIEAPVFSVKLVSECLSQGEMRVSCSSEGGDSPQYSWTLDGRALTDAELLYGSNEANNITLRQNISGHLVCSANNHVSNVSKGENISTCGFIFINCISNGTQISQWVFEANNTLCIKPTDPTTVTDTTVGKESGIVSVKPSTNITSSNQTVSSSTDDPWYIKKRIFPIMAGIFSALLIFLVVGIAVICAQRKKQNNKPQEEDDDHELTYADVKIVQRQGRRVQQRAVEEVEYGQVKFSERPRHTESTGDDCVYAKVRKSR